MTQVEKAIRRLETQLGTGQVKVGIAPNGAVVFQGWADRDDIVDACAFRTLQAQSSFALRQAIARAEATSGRRVNANAVAMGLHSHDGGRTWDKGH
jgi:hypothetical protein